MEEGTFGARIRRARLRINLSQEELADRAGITANAVGALERGEHRHPYPATIRALTAALSMSPEESAALAASVPARPRRSRRLTPSRFGVRTELVSLLGRDREKAEISAALRRNDIRLVTLTGPGGVGKTQLALAVARDLSDEFDDTLVLELASLSDYHLVSSTITRTFGVPERAGEDLMDRISKALDGQRILLLLDNFEHVLPAAPLITDLVSACPGLTALVTSRVALRLTGERVMPTPPLAVPPSSETSNIDALREVPSVQLFVARASAIDPAFALTASNASAVAALCQRLDGLPLALELAATRTPHLTPQAIHERLAWRLPLLTAGRRDAPARHRTMRDAIAWSYHLLDPEEQVQFRRLSVFAGGCTLEGAEAVLELDSVAVRDGLDTISSLIDHNLLLQVAGSDQNSRYAMLATVRDYALEQLDVHGEADLVRDRHAAWYVHLAEAAWSELYSVGWPAVVQRLAAEQDNLRAAMAWLYSTRQTDLFLRLTGALGRYWHIAGTFHEGRDWLERALTLGPDVHTVGSARSLASAGYLAHCLGDDDRAVQYLERAALLARGLNDAWMEAGATLDHGIVEEDRGDYDAAEARFTAALALFEASHHRQGPLVASHHLGIIAYARGDWSRAVTLWESGIAAARAAGDPLTLAWNLEYLGLMLAEQRAATRAAEALRACLALDERGAIAHWGRVLATIAVLGSTLADGAAADAAARLQAAAMTANEVDGEQFTLPERDAFVRAEGKLRSQLGESRYASAWNKGRSMEEADVRDSIAVILNAASPSWEYRLVTLSPRERDVLDLLITGRTNQEIADALYIGRRTVATHIEHIFTKLGVSSRAAVTQLVTQGKRAEPFLE